MVLSGVPSNIDVLSTPLQNVIPLLEVHVTVVEVPDPLVTYKSEPFEPAALLKKTVVPSILKLTPSLIAIAPPELPVLPANILLSITTSEFVKCNAPPSL